MKHITVGLTLFLLASSVLGAEAVPEQELTGVFRAQSGKTDPHLEIDGHGLIKNIALSGDTLEGLADGTRVWVSGHIVTGLYGSPKTERQQAHPTQWMIVMQATKHKVTSKPFERPRDR